MLRLGVLRSILVLAGLVVGPIVSAPAAEAAKPSVTVFPVVVTPNRGTDEMARRIGMVVATFLERGGLEQLELADAPFSPPETDDVQEIAAALGRHVAAHPIHTDYALFAQFLGTPASGVKGIRTVVVDKAGQAILADSAGSDALAQAPVPPKDPMTCCLFVARRLEPLWKLADPLRPDAPQGKMAQFWRNDAGIPPKEELAAMQKRAEGLKAAIRTAGVTVYPVRVGRETDRQCAVELVDLLQEAGLKGAQAAERDPALAIAPHSNEQKVLWDTARAFRDYVRRNPPATAYAAYADYGLGGEDVHHVHVVVCDREGQWVLVDMQNSHHEDFQRIAPRSAADCNRLVIARLDAWLSDAAR